MHVLVKFACSYGDEFDISGYVIFEAKEWEDQKIRLISYFDEGYIIYYYFGSNESVEWVSYEEFVKTIVEIDLSETELKVLQTRLGLGYGFFPNFDEVNNYINSKEEFEQAKEYPEEL